MTTNIDIQIEQYATAIYLAERKIGEIARSGRTVEATWFHANGSETRSRWFDGSDRSADAFNYITKLEGIS